MDIYSALEKDHRKVEQLLDQLERASLADNDQWKSILDELREEVIKHSRAEEAVFYNALREMDHAKDAVSHSYAEHAKAETELRALGAAQAIDQNWTSMVEKLREDLQHHIDEEEDRVFTAAREVLSDEEAQQIGQAFERLKPEMSEAVDSITKNTIEFVSNLLPRRLVDTFKRNASNRGKRAA